MKRILTMCLFLIMGTLSYSQTNNPVSIYEGETVRSVRFAFKNLPTDTMAVRDLLLKVESTFRIYPNNQYSSFLASYYVSQIVLLPFVESAELDITTSTENSIELTVDVTLASEQSIVPKRENAFRTPSALPTIYNSKRTFLELKIAASEMAYSNNNAWFAQPVPITTGNPLANSPSGEGFTGWMEGFGSVGVYGITKLIPKINLHLYGGVNYLVSFSAGNELFTNRARIYGDVEEAFVGFIGGGRTAAGNVYRYNTLYGRKQFTLGDGWLIINTSMNGDNRAALQLNPRWASKHVFQTGFMWNRMFIQGFRLQANELPTLSSATTLTGLNFEYGNKDRALLGASFVQAVNSRFKYYMPDGEVHSRDGLQVFNLRLFQNAPQGKNGLFFKLEGGYERNKNFDMSAWAYYGELGWSFARTKGSPSVSYRYAYFSGDDPDSRSFNRWDALYTGGNGEQWVQGSNMYKIVQNSNEISHRLQAIYRPMRKVQLVGQIWLFYAAQKVNLGGNPALSMLKSKSYGSEYNLTLKYFHSRSWYFHFNAAYTLPGSAIRDNIPDTRNWLCLMAFARYSF